METKPIKTKKDYSTALKTIEALLDCTPKSKEAALLEALAILVDEYEHKHFPIEVPGKGLDRLNF